MDKDIDATWAIFRHIRRDEGSAAAWEWLRVHWLLEAARKKERQRAQKEMNQDDK